MASQAVGPEGRVVGVDLKPIEPPLMNENAVALVADLNDPDLAERICTALGGPAQLLLCDAAPKLTGVRVTDRANEERLLLSVSALIPVLLRRGGTLLLKLLEGPEAAALGRQIASGFGRARSLRPAATRKGSSERYLLAREYRGDSSKLPKRSANSASDSRPNPSPIETAGS